MDEQRKIHTEFYLKDGKQFVEIESLLEYIRPHLGDKADAIELQIRRSVDEGLKNHAESKKWYE